jgi:ParB family chromosome partitioning protein
MAQKKALGRGLGALLPSAQKQPQAPQENQKENLEAKKNQGAENQASPQAQGNKNIEQNLGVELEEGERIRQIKPSQIVPNEFQPRREFNASAIQDLSQSIKEKGILQPLVVREKKEGLFELIAGERRWRAAKLAGLDTVPVLVKRTTDRESLELALIENIQRENLNCVEEALSYFTLLEDFQLTQETLAKRVGKDRATVTNALRILKLPDEVLQLLKNNELSRGHGKVLLSLSESEDQIHLAQKSLKESWSVRELEKRVKRFEEGKNHTGISQAASPPAEDSQLKQVKDTLEKKYNAKVLIKGKNKGKIIFEYNSSSHFNELYDKFVGQS